MAIEGDLGEPELIDTGEYAIRMGVSAGTVERWMSEKKLVPDMRTPGGAPRFWWPPKEQREG